MSQKHSEQLNRRLFVCIIISICLTFFVGMYLWLRVLAYRHYCRQQAYYHAELEQLSSSYARELHRKVSGITDDGVSPQQREERVDDLFEFLRASPLISSREDLARWRNAVKSPERTGMVLKWAEEVARVAIMDAELHSAMKYKHLNK